MNAYGLLYVRKIGRRPCRYLEVLVVSHCLSDETNSVSTKPTNANDGARDERARFRSLLRASLISRFLFKNFIDGLNYNDEG